MKIGKYEIPYVSVLSAPYALAALGLLSNFIVISANHHLMPVLFPGGDCSLHNPEDLVHTCMTQATHLKALADIFISSESVSSIGDFMMEMGEATRIPLLVAWVILAVRSITNRKSV